MRRVLADLSSKEISGRPIVLVPVGSLEHHGPHLPLDTDTTIATAVVDAVAESLHGEVLVAPPLNYGSSDERRGFEWTSSIGAETLQNLIVELVRSMSAWAGRIVFVSAHGGNISALSNAVFQMIAERHDVAWVPCSTEDLDLHASITETSLMLHLRPDSVHFNRAEGGHTSPLDEILPSLIAGGVPAVSPNGVLGDPRKATAHSGAWLMCWIVDDVQRRIITGRTDVRGMLAVPMGAAAR